jgi:hypothetical protein
MQKISTYLYPNRIQLLADLAGFPVEYTNVYQRNIKIYKGIDNVLEFDVKNPDQKRIDLSGYTLTLHIMDASGQGVVERALVNLNQTTSKGLAKVTVAASDLVALNGQFFKFSVTALDEEDNPLMLYGDTQFGAKGTMELVSDALPIARPSQTHTSFYPVITGATELISTYYSSSIPTKFYEAVPSTDLDLTVHMTNFVGEIWLEATKHTTITHESFRDAPKIVGPIIIASPSSTTLSWSNISISDYSYFRIGFHKSAGTIDKVVV